MLGLGWHQWLRSHLPAHCLQCWLHGFQHCVQLNMIVVQNHVQLGLLLLRLVLLQLPSCSICLLLLLQQALLELRLCALLRLRLEAHQLLHHLPMVVAQAELVLLVLPHVLYVEGVLLKPRRRPS